MEPLLVLVVVLVGVLVVVEGRGAPALGDSLG